MRAKQILACLFLSALVGSAIYAQLGTTSLTGTVTDQSGAAIAGAHASATQISTGAKRETQTTADGVFTMANLPPARYEVRIAAPGFAEAVFRDLVLEVGQRPSLRASLQVAAVREVVEVVGGPPLLDTSTSQVAGVIESRTIEALPLNGRNFLDLAFLIPGNRPAPNFDPTKTTTLEVSSAGQFGRGGNIAVDGADNNDDMVGGTLQNFPQDAIQEFQIVSRFSAEVGRSASSAVNITTRSGTNEIHGSAGFFIRHDALSGLPATLDRGIVKTLGRPSFDREQFAGTLGGPFVRNRAWWFTAFEYRRQEAVILTGQRDFAQRRVVTTFAPAPLRDVLLTSRADWQVKANDHLGVRYSLQRENDVDRGSLRRPIGTADNRQHSFNNYQSVVGNWLRTFSPSLLNDLVFHENNFINRIPAFVTGRNELRFPSVQDGANFRIPQQTRQNRIQLRDNVSLSAGAHSLRFGGEYQRIDTDVFFDLFGSGSIFLTEDFASRDRNRDGRIDDIDIPIGLVIRSVAPLRPPTVGDIDNNFLAAYVQDDWRVSPNLTLNLGLRYELDTDVKNTSRFNEINPIVRPFLRAGGRSMNTTNFAPRFGFNWDPFRDGRTSIRGGYGIYYDRIVLEVPLLERLLDGRALPLEVRAGSVFDAAGDFTPGSPTLANPFGGPVIPGAGAIGINVIDNGLANPYAQHFNLGVQREIVPSLSLSVEGIHAFGSKFIIGRPIGSVFNPVVEGPDSVVNIESSVKTWYDAMLVNVRKRYSKRFSLNASYVLSKSFNFSNDDQIPFQVGPLDPNNLRLEKGPPPHDELHRFTFHGVFDAPWGVQISPIVTSASSVPIDIFLPDGSTRVPPLQRNAGARLFKTGRELNAFLREVNAAGGIRGVGLLPLVRDELKLGDSFQSVDLRVSNTFQIADRWKLRATAEAFNLFNITNIRGVNNVNYSGFQNALIRDSEDRGDPGFLRSSAFGQSLQTAGGVFGTGGPRAFQFALRVEF